MVNEIIRLTVAIVLTIQTISNNIGQNDRPEDKNHLTRVLDDVRRKKKNLCCVYNFIKEFVLTYSFT